MPIQNFVLRTLLAFATLINSLFIFADTAIQFNGKDSYADINMWQPTGAFKVVVWLGTVPDSNEKVILLSNSISKEFISFTANSIQLQFGSDYPGIWNKMHFEDTRFLEITVKKGELTVSDGINIAYMKSPAIRPTSVSYDWLFRRSISYSEGALQALALIDLNDHTNSRNMGFTDNGNASVISQNGDAHLYLHNVTQNDLITGLEVPRPNLPQATNVRELTEKILERYPNRPMIDSNDNNGNEYAWQGNYWIRAYLHFYSVTQDIKYINWAIELANKMLNDTDQERATRQANFINDYTRAPKALLINRDLLAPGWKQPTQGSSVEVLSDGMILNAVMRLVDTIKEQKLIEYDATANNYMSKAVKIIKSHDNSFSVTKNTAINGSYFYVNPNNVYMDDRGLFNNPLAHNHNFAMATAMIYLDKWLGGVEKYQNIITNISDFFINNLIYLSDGTCEWNYSYDTRGDQYEKYEDVNHGHIDIGFFVVAEQEGYFHNERAMHCFAKTATQKIAIGPGPIPEKVTGTGISKYSEQIAFAYDWRGLAKYDQSILARSDNILRNYIHFSWAREYTALALTLTE